MGHQGQSARRDGRIDTLRGLFLVIMTVDHLPDQPLLNFTRQTLGFVSAAEGFVCVSGVVTGWIFGKILLKQGQAALRHRAWNRARDIYLTHLLLYTIALVASRLGGRPVGGQYGFLDAWWRGALLIHQPPLFGILPMYAIFLFLTPWLIQQMAKGRAPLIWAGSLALWLSAQAGLGTPAHNPAWLELGFFNIVAWQLLFVAGTYFGFARAKGEPSLIPSSRTLLILSATVMVCLFLVRHHIFPFQHLKLIDTYVALGVWRATLHPLRMINFAASAYVLWFLPRSIDERVHRFTITRFLRHLGKHSLQVFAWSVLVCYFAVSLKASWMSASSVWRILMVLGAVLSLSLPAWLHAEWRKYRSSVRSDVLQVAKSVS